MASSSLERHERPRTPPAQIMEALAHLAKNGGNIMKTSEELGIQRRTLSRWREDRRDDYTALQARLRNKLEDQVIGEVMEDTLALGKARRLAVQRTTEKLERDDDQRPSQTLKDLAITLGVLTDKRLLLEGRPTSIQGQSTADEDLRALKARAIPDAQVVDVEPESEPT